MSVITPTLPLWLFLAALAVVALPRFTPPEVHSVCLRFPPSRLPEVLVSSLAALHGRRQWLNDSSSRFGRGSSAALHNLVFMRFQQSRERFVSLDEGALTGLLTGRFLLELTAGEFHESVFISVQNPYSASARIATRLCSHRLTSCPLTVTVLWSLTS